MKKYFLTFSIFTLGLGFSFSQENRNEIKSSNIQTKEINEKSIETQALKAEMKTHSIEAKPLKENELETIKIETAEPKLERVGVIEKKSNNKVEE